MEVTLREKGRITVPASIRKTLGLCEGDRLQLFAERGAIILKPKRTITAEEIKGIIGPIEVEVEDVESALGADLS